MGFYPSTYYFSYYDYDSDYSGSTGFIYSFLDLMGGLEGGAGTGGGWIVLLVLKGATCANLSTMKMPDPWQRDVGLTIQSPPLFLNSSANIIY